MSKLYLLPVIGLFALAGCGLDTTLTGSSTDATAAQQFLPNISGYIATDADGIAEALTTAGAGVSLITGNPVTAVMVNRLDAMIDCYQAVGAVAARIYTEVNIGAVAGGAIPAVGAVAVINEDRLRDNLVACAVSSVTGFRAQDAAEEPCSASGSFSAGEDTLHYVYGATKPELCALFAQAFQSR